MGIFPRGRADRCKKPAPPLKTELHCCSVVCLTRPPARQLAYGRLFALGNRAGVVRKSFPPRIAGCSSRLCLSVSSLPSSLFFCFLTRAITVVAQCYGSQIIVFPLGWYLLSCSPWYVFLGEGSGPRVRRRRRGGEKSAFTAS